MFGEKEKEDVIQIKAEPKDPVHSDRAARHNKSIIVLPFENISPDPDQLHF